MNLKEFTEYLKKVKKMANNSLQAYSHDMEGFAEYLRARGIDDMTEVTNTDVVSYLLYLKEEERSASTINRKLASIRAYYNFLINTGKLVSNPTANIKSPKVERKEIEYLTIEEVDRLLETPDDTVKGKRDRAILELLYATGIRVNEIVAANTADLNLRIGFFTCPGDSGKARIVPIGRPARAALEEYIYSARNAYIKEDKDEPALFLNHRGKRMTRQGLWKVLKEYGEKAELSKTLTPHILRNSFAVHMVQNGADLKSLKELMGHEDMTAMQIYLTVTKSRIKDVYDKTHPRA